MMLVLVAVTLALALPGVARAACPDHQYLGNYPNNRQFNWSEDVQGIAHDSRNWFFTQTSRILKLPVRADLNLSLRDQPPGWRGVDGLPTELSVRGYNHYGDPQVHGGFLFVPMEGGDKTAIAAFRASTLRSWTSSRSRASRATPPGWRSTPPKACSTPPTWRCRRAGRCSATGSTYVRCAAPACRARASSTGR